MYQALSRALCQASCQAQLQAPNFHVTQATSITLFYFYYVAIDAATMLYRTTVL